MKNEVLIYGALGVAAVILLTKGKAGNYVGQSVGNAAGGVVAGATEGLVESIFISPYEWAYNYPKKIPIIDDIAKGAVWVKRIGNDDKWFS